MYEQDGVLVIEVGLSGVRFEDVSVRVQGAHLVIAARRPQEDGERRYHVRGRRVPRESVYEVILPPNVCPDQATATYVHGLLRVCIPLGAEESSSGTPIPIKELEDVRARGRRGVRAGRGSQGEERPGRGRQRSSVTGSISQTRRAGASRICDAWMDRAAVGEPLRAAAPAHRYDLCEACVPIDRKRGAWLRLLYATAITVPFAREVHDHLADAGPRRRTAISCRSDATSRPTAVPLPYSSAVRRLWPS
jgi:hypothetical protein